MKIKTIYESLWSKIVYEKSRVVTNYKSLIANVKYIERDYSLSTLYVLNNYVEDGYLEQ